MSKLSARNAFDQDKINNGIPCVFVIGSDKFRATITRGGSANKALQVKAAELIRPYARSGADLTDIDPVIQREIRAELLSSYVILGWNEDDFGEPFTVEACKRELLNNTEWADHIDVECQRANSFRVDKIAAIAGN